jgi:hypothetical protein
MSNVEAPSARSQYVDFWSNVLVPKFVRWRHILVDGLALHSAKVFPTLAVRPGDKVIDAGCGFGDTAIQLKPIRSRPSTIFVFRDSERNSSRIQWRACATCARASSPAAP